MHNLSQLTWGDADEAADRWLDSRAGGCYFVFSSWSCYALLAMATIATTVDAIWNLKSQNPLLHLYIQNWKAALHTICVPQVFPSKKKTCSWLVHLDLHCFFRQLDTQFATVKTILFLVHDPTNLYFGLASIFMNSGILLDPISQGTCKMTLTITSEPYAHDKAAWNVLSTVIPHHILDFYASNWSPLTCAYTSSTPSAYSCVTFPVTCTKL